MPEPIRLALVWHMHQPSYRDAETGGFLLPWVRLHATKDYRDMATLLRRYPRVHATFNLTPILLEQLDAVAAGESDPYLELARRPAQDLSEDERRMLVAQFFDVNQERMLEPHAPYRELKRRASALSVQDLLDLQVWFHLAWVDPQYRQEEPIRFLFQKGEGFSEEEKLALLDWGIACAGSVVGEYQALAATGQIELSTSAYHHPILPLLIDSDSPRENSESIDLPVPPLRASEDAAEQVRRSVRSHARRFGAPPRGTWPPEGAVSQPTLALLAEAGFAWAASDEAVLAGALTHRDGQLLGWPGPLYRSHWVDTAAGPIAMVFRDRALSDLIGFTYAHWDPRHAAEDFIRRVRGARDAVPADESPVVTVILDGENCWESYPGDGRPFLSALYEMLEADPEIEPVTVSEALDRVPPSGRLSHVPVGSWIRGDLGIWVGHAEKNRAWEELGLARRAAVLAANSESGTAGVAAAMEELYAAEASDWFWWYGDDHPSAHRDRFDRLFRAHLIRAYRHLGAVVPASLLQSLRAGDRETGAGREPQEGEAVAIPIVRAVLDGRETDDLEWRLAARYEPGGAMGSMHRASGLLRAVRFGTDGEHLYLRVDLEGGPTGRSGASVLITFAELGERSARIALGAADRGAPDWSGGPAGGNRSDSGAFAADQIVEVRLPLRSCVETRGESIRFRVCLERGGQPEEFAPHTGWFELAVPGVP